MAKIHMQTENVRSLAQLMARQADRFMEKSESLGRICGRLSGAWMGGSGSERYLSKLRALAKKFESQSYALQQLSIRVNREVDEWAEKDAHFSGKSSLAVERIPFGENVARVYEPNFFQLIRGNVSPYTLQEAFSYLENSEAGKDLLDQAKKAGICFEIQPEGTIIGDPNLEHVSIRWGEAPGGLGYQNGNEIVISNDLDFRYKGKDQIASILGHEMQHAVDRKNGLLLSYDGIENIRGVEQLESFLEARTETRIASEIRAFERGFAIDQVRSYSDDGINTYQEKAFVIFDQDYQKIYESQINSMFAGRYTADCWLDGAGQLQIDLQEIDLTAYTLA